MTDPNNQNTGRSELQKLGDPLRHPGFYKGDDCVEWAKNMAAIKRYQADSLRNSQYVEKRGADIMTLDGEAKMFDELVVFAEKIRKGK